MNHISEMSSESKRISHRPMYFVTFWKLQAWVCVQWKWYVPAGMKPASDRGAETEFFPTRKHDIDKNQVNLPDNLANVNQKLGFSAIR